MLFRSSKQVPRWVGSIARWLLSAPWRRPTTWLVCIGGVCTFAALAGLGAEPMPKAPRGSYSGRVQDLWADTQHLYWTEVGVKEYDDEPAHLTAAAVRRRRHGARDVEELFDFERDGLRCTPWSLTPLPDGIGFYGAQEWVDGPFDRPHVVYASAEHAPRAWPVDAHDHRLATGDGEAFYVVTGYARSALSRVDSRTGATERIAELPEQLGDVRALLGMNEDRIIGQAIGPDRQTLLFAVPRSGGSVSILARLRQGYVARPRATAAEGGIAIAWEPTDRDHRVAVLVDGQLEDVARPRGPAGDLVLRGHDLYFGASGEIVHVDLRSRRETVVARAERQPSFGRAIAVGGGRLYWVSDDGAIRESSMERPDRQSRRSSSAVER